MKRVLYIRDRDGYIVAKINDVAEMRSQKLWEKNPFDVTMMHHVIGDSGAYLGSVFAGNNWTLERA